MFELESNIIDENTFKNILLINKGEKLSKIVKKNLENTFQNQI